MSDFIAAACVGISQVSIGHPFETTLTLIQNNKPYKKCLLKITIEVEISTLLCCDI